MTDKLGVAGLDRQQLQELGRLYRTASADLSRARTLKLGNDVQTYLNNLVVRAHNQVYQTDRNRWLDLFRFLWEGFPRLVRENILYLVLSTLILVVPATGAYQMVIRDTHFAQLEIMRGYPLVQEELWSMIEKKQMWTDAVQDQSPPFFSLISTNNIRVAIMAFVSGIVFGFGTVFVLFNNGLNFGTILGLCQVNGMGPTLLQFVVAHGVLEIPAIIISGAAGLIMGKSLLFPGKYKRLDAFRIAGRRAVGLFAGTVPMLLVAGLIESFISPRTDIPADFKYLLGVCGLVSLVLYLFIPRGSSDKYSLNITES